MQRVVGSARKPGVDLDQVLHITNLARQNNSVSVHTELLCAFRTQQRARHQCLTHHLSGVQGLGTVGIVVHHARQQSTVQTTPVDTDTDRLVILDGFFDHGRVLTVSLVAKTHVSWIDTVFRQRTGTIRIVLQQTVTVVVKVAHQWYVAADSIQPFANSRYGARGFGRIHRNTHQLRPRPSERLDLLDCGSDVGGVGVGHGLHHHWRISAHGDRAYGDTDAFSSNG